MSGSWNISLALLLLTLSSVSGAKILVYPIDGSHWVNMKVLVEELHSKGHNVTVIRASESWYIKEKSPFYTSVTIPNTGGFNEEFFAPLVARSLQLKRQIRSWWSNLWYRIQLELENVEQFSQFHKKMSEMIVQIFEDKDLIKSFHDANYDLVLADPGIAGGEMLAHLLKVPLVFNVRWTIQGEGHVVMAPSPLSYVPFVATELTDKMTFPQRVGNVLSYIFGCRALAQITEPHYQPLVSRYFGPSVDYKQLLHGADIWLMRTDFVFDFPRPTMPNIVYIAGFQCKPSKPLPKDLEEFVQSSGDHGIIIMTLGTLIGTLPEDVTEDIAAAFALLPQKVLWRYTGKRPASLGNNTLLMDWLPQNDLLGHPKARAFVAHGGTNGVQEAIYHGVPIVGLPLVFDQPDNLSKISARGAAKIADFITLTRSSFADALREVLYNSSYRENMQTLSRLHRDQPMKPLDRAVFWIEYVIRNRGAPHLKAESLKMSWCVYHSVDVIATLLTIALIFTLFCVFIVKSLCKMICREKKGKRE